MPYDKQNTAGGAGRPFIPTSSAANMASKAPLTPRIATSTVASTSISPTLRRGAYNDAGCTPKGNLKEDLSTPVKTFLNSNITPRSSSRKARVDSTSSTPNRTPSGTPSNSKPASLIEPLRLADEFAAGGLGIGTHAFEGKTMPRPTSVVSEGKQSSISFASSLSGQHNPGQTKSDLGDQELSPRFFYASDVRSPALAVRHSPPESAANSKMTNFFYANSVGNMPTAASPVSSSLETGPQAKFFRANELSELQAGRRALHTHSTSSTGTSPIPGYVLSAPPQLKPPRLASLNPALQASEKHQPSSPPKDATSVAPLRRAPPVTHLQFTSALRLGQGQQGLSALQEPGSAVASQKPAPEDQPRRASHGRSASVGSLDSNTRTQMSSRVDITCPSSSASKLSLATNVADGIPDELPEKHETGPSGEWSSALPRATAPVPQVPVKNTPSYSVLQQMDLAVNARRERKVLDLEISNSSLLAINRTLEREMRKQCAELRRYRRLSRSGRLSLTSVPAGPVPRSLSGMAEYEDQSDQSDMVEEDEESLSDDDSLEEGSLSPDAVVASDARHREKDERRLQLDLSKHQQLLIDSQKMNQSLKKCLGWTEELISEGRKALAYRVRVSDVQLGGRVLVPDDIEDSTRDTYPRGSRVSHGSELASALTPERERDDRDSGVDLEQGSNTHHTSDPEG
ncbi:hypothetical protein GP486_001237 [Trichoglossum hirsutum]|uniref:Uncharacterized protein n=1 Tax=Trichoglossum hirsutum TaxID=265104 RepID=A0A9P8LH23_9PEZI|nr:hypothetical protein GP486_001237 [Trichoglossum hirsutum]